MGPSRMKLDPVTPPDVGAEERASTDGLTSSVSEFVSQSQPSVTRKRVLICVDPDEAGDRDDLADVGDPRGEVEHRPAVGQRQVGREVVERRHEAQRVAAARRRVVDQHLPAVLAGDPAQEVRSSSLVWRRIAFCSAPMSAPPAEELGAGEDRRERRADRVDERHERVLGRDEGRDADVGDRDVADRRDADREPAQLVPVLQLVDPVVGRDRQRRHPARREGGRGAHDLADEHLGQGVGRVARCAGARARRAAAAGGRASGGRRWRSRCPRAARPRAPR